MASNELTVLPMVDETGKVEYKGEEVPRWMKVSLAALNEFLRPREAVMINMNAENEEPDRWLVWRWSPRNYSFINPKTSDERTGTGLDGLETGQLIKITNVAKGSGLPTGWELLD